MGCCLPACQAHHEWAGITLKALRAKQVRGQAQL